MTSKIKVDNINKVSDDSNIIKKCGSTTTVGSGAGNTIVACGSTITLGRCGGTVALASGATQTGFGRTGTVDWDTTPKTATFSAVSGNGYFCNTSGGAFTVNLPAGSAGAIISLADYASTFQTHNLTVAPNGSEKIGGSTIDATLITEGQSITLVYVDATEGWVTTADSGENVLGENFITATVSGTGNTLATAPCCANTKIATFTGPGTFCVSQIASSPTNNVVSYLVTAGGGGGSADGSQPQGGAGGGAGGYREVKTPVTPYTASPLDGYATAPNRVTVSATAYPITVGGGGPGSTNVGTPGSASTFSTITSAGGGSGGQYNGSTGASGGSGGGGGANAGVGGAGNTPPVSPPQGNNGSPAPSASSPGAGGGASAAASGVTGGVGVTSSISSTSIAYAGGGANGTCGGCNGSPCGTGGDKRGNGTTNRGGGAGGGDNSGAGGNGGSGVVIIRYKFQ